MTILQQSNLNWMAYCWRFYYIYDNSVDIFGNIIDSQVAELIVWGFKWNWKKYIGFIDYFENKCT